MIYSPSILVFRTDDGRWLPPYEVDILTSPAVNAGVVRSRSHHSAPSSDLETQIAETMHARMARILALAKGNRRGMLVLA